MRFSQVNITRLFLSTLETVINFVPFSRRFSIRTEKKREKSKRASKEPTRAIKIEVFDIRARTQREETRKVIDFPFGVGRK